MLVLIMMIRSHQNWDWIVPLAEGDKVALEIES